MKRFWCSASSPTRCAKSRACCPRSGCSRATSSAAARRVRAVRAERAVRDVCAALHAVLCYAGGGRAGQRGGACGRTCRWMAGGRAGGRVWHGGAQGPTGSKCTECSALEAFHTPPLTAALPLLFCAAAAARGKAIRDFQTDPPTKVFLLTHRQARRGWRLAVAGAPGTRARKQDRAVKLPACTAAAALTLPAPRGSAICRAGGAGITLTAGTHIVLCEPTLNPSFERQVGRLGGWAGGPRGGRGGHGGGGGGGGGGRAGGRGGRGQRGWSGCSAHAACLAAASKQPSWVRRCHTARPVPPHRSHPVRAPPPPPPPPPTHTHTPHTHHTHPPTHPPPPPPACRPSGAATAWARPAPSRSPACS